MAVAQGRGGGGGCCLLCNIVQWGGGWGAGGLGAGARLASWLLLFLLRKCKLSRIVVHLNQGLGRFLFPGPVLFLILDFKLTQA